MLHPLHSAANGKVSMTGPKERALDVQGFQPGPNLHLSPLRISEMAQGLGGFSRAFVLP